ncbi:regucalcin-like [Agrilus planipennis]|uniref:Regucalcin n=1 Tax=Agrilus planipennis TaxID=224129 RepID=A0A1W4XIB0_AGRPL|nr:regucalcin-like [Agrilus planipennis]
MNLSTTLCLIVSLGVIDGYIVTTVTDPLEHSECPMWDNLTNRLYFVDIHKGGIYYFSPDNKKTNHINLVGTVAPVLPTTSSTKKFIVGLNRTVSAVEWDGESNTYDLEVLTTVARDYPMSRTNDGKADLNGRLYIGTMGYEDTRGSLNYNQGALYEITAANLEDPDVLLSPVNVSNGMAWNKANDKLYYIDTPTRQIREFNYDADTGAISFSRVAFDLEANGVTGNPDGMTIDTDDNLWIALYSGGAVIKVNSVTGEWLESVDIPAERVTSVAFGGDKLDILFVTSSRYGLTEDEIKQQPLAGSVFAVFGLEARGFPASRVKY